MKLSKKKRHPNLEMAPFYKYAAKDKLTLNDITPINIIHFSIIGLEIGHKKRATPFRWSYPFNQTRRGF
jgi:hypothetical protein